MACALAACGADPEPAPPDMARPVYSTCPNEPRATPESLADKAAGYDARATALHMHARMPWVLDVDLEATLDQVAAWRSGENDGLWNGLYLASQAYRFAVTHDPAARANLATLLEGERQRMRITGVSGLLTRQLIPPGVPGIACPTEASLYVPSPDKRGNRWVRIGSDGCAQVADGAGVFSSTSHCGLGEFAGWCFLDNISQDEYVGHLFGLSAVARLVDDAPLRAAAQGLLDEIGAHLSAHGMEFIDWDGRPTQWGKIHPGAAGDSPGYLAILGLAFSAQTGATAEHEREWLEWPAYFNQIGTASGCMSNWNDISMLMASFHQAIWLEPDAARRQRLQDLWKGELTSALSQKNAWFDILWAAQTSDPSTVEAAVCQLKQFPASNELAARDTAALQPDSCAGRQGESLAAKPFDVADRCAATFVWWQNPYERRSCPATPTEVHQPTGYLLPYWMARYYGFI